MWSAPEGPEGLAAVPVGGGGAWPGFETMHRTMHQRPGATGVEGAGGTGGPGCGARGRWRGLAGLRDDAPSEARGADGERAGRRPPGSNTQTSKRTQAPRTPSRQHATRTPSRQHATRTPSRRAAATRHQHAEHAHTTRPGPAAPNSAEDPGLVKQSDQAVHHEGGECFERGLDLALGQRCERCDGIVGPGAREFARLIEHVVGAQAFHDRGEGLVGE